MKIDKEVIPAEYEYTVIFSAAEFHLLQFAIHIANSQMGDTHPSKQTVSSWEAQIKSALYL